MLNPGIVKVTGLGVGSPSAKVLDASGTPVGSLSNVLSILPLPPGSYKLKIAGQVVPFTLHEGQTVKIKLQ